MTFGARFQFAEAVTSAIVVFTRLDSQHHLPLLRPFAVRDTTRPPDSRRLRRRRSFLANRPATVRPTLPGPKAHPRCADSSMAPCCLSCAMPFFGATLSRRTSRQTECPSPTSDLISAVPTSPVAPVIRTFMHSPEDRRSRLQPPCQLRCLDTLVRQPRPIRFPQEPRSQVRLQLTASRGFHPQAITMLEPVELPNPLRWPQSRPGATIPVCSACQRHQSHAAQCALFWTIEGRSLVTVKSRGNCVGSSIEDVFALCVARYRELGAHRKRNGRVAQPGICRMDDALQAGDEVAFLPPVSGG